ncbi:hypothetical protein TWF281_006600 [Arthrobotrys megalospora]
MGERDNLVKARWNTGRRQRPAECVSIARGKVEPPLLGLQQGELEWEERRESGYKMVEKINIAISQTNLELSIGLEQICAELAILEGAICILGSAIGFFPIAVHDVISIREKFPSNVSHASEVGQDLLAPPSTSLHAPIELNSLSPSGRKEGDYMPSRERRHYWYG